MIWLVENLEVHACSHKMGSRELGESSCCWVTYVCTGAHSQRGCCGLGSPAGSRTTIERARVLGHTDVETVRKGVHDIAATRTATKHHPSIEHPDSITSRHSVTDA